MSIGTRGLEWRGKTGRRKPWQRIDARGQVTVFVILGIVILVVVVMAMVGISSIAKLKLQQEANNAVNNYLESESINYYVYTCMDTAVTSAIDDLSLQGGTFYTYQGGPYNTTLADPGVTYIPYNLTFTSTNGSKRTLDFNVSYSVLSKGYCNIVNLQVPEYPNKTGVTLSDLYNIYEAKNNSCLLNYEEGYGLSGFAGFNNMSRLCFIGSDNTNPVGTTGIYYLTRSPCTKTDNLIVARNRSVEYILQDQISLRVKNCTDFTVFETTQGDNVTILNDPATKVTLTFEGISVSTVYNFSVRLGNKQPVLVKHTFKYDSSLRIVRLHNYVMALLKADSKDFIFNISKDYRSYPWPHPELGTGVSDYYDPEHMNVTVIGFENDSACVWPACKYKYDHLLIVKDNASLIGNRSLTYVTALKNRIPALDFIHTAPPGYYDIIVSSNQTIYIDPWGYDPDDQKVWYQYEDWKETYDEKCTLPGVIGDPIICTRTSPPLLLAPHNWTRSGLFQQTQREANYTTNSSDYGPHNVTVTVFDESGLFDYQIIKILVFDLPVANITPISIYSDIPNNIASVEDLLLLDGSSSTPSIIGGGVITDYIWAIHFWNTSLPVPQWQDVYYNKSPTSTKVLPLDYPLPPITDRNELIQKIKPLNLSNIGEHNVTLAVESTIPLLNGNQIVSSLFAYQDVNVTMCVPHRNTTDVYSYPYNNGDPFTANHNCCAGTLDTPSSYAYITPAGSACYTAAWYGEFNQLKVKSTDLKMAAKLTYYPGAGTLTNNPSSISQRIFENDIYKLDFIRKCDGLRGNLCAGDMTATYIRQLPDCADWGPGEEERCSGPNDPVDPSKKDCVKYTSGNTFELKFGALALDGSTATGRCNHQEACSVPNANGYNVPAGHALCKAECDGNGGCTYASDCRCSFGSCGAQCDATHTYQWFLGTFDCKHSCTTNCVFQTTTLKCKASSNNPATQYCPADDGGKDYCYASSCNANGGLSTKLGICERGEQTPGPTPGTTCCLYAAPAFVVDCPSGVCNLQKECRSNSQLIGCSCDPNTGWTGGMC